MSGDSLKFSREVIDEYKTGGLCTIIEQLRLCEYVDAFGHSIEYNAAFKALQELADEEG